MKPGDEVVCIKDMSSKWHERNARHWHVTPPVVGQHYIVRGRCPTSRKVHRILLEEIRNPDVRFTRFDKGEASFEIEKFRLVKKDTITVDATVSFTIGADAASRKWDNRRKKKAHA